MLKKGLNKIIIFVLLITCGMTCIDYTVLAAECNSEYKAAVELLKNDYGMDDFLFSQLEQSDVIEMARHANLDSEYLSIII